MLDPRKTALWNALGLGPQWVERNTLAQALRPQAKAAVGQRAPGASAIEQRAPGASAIEQHAPGASAIEQRAPGASTVGQRSAGASVPGARIASHPSMADLASSRARNAPLETSGSFAPSHTTVESEELTFELPTGKNRLAPNALASSRDAGLSFDLPSTASRVTAAKDASEISFEIPAGSLERSTRAGAPARSSAVGFAAAPTAASTPSPTSTRARAQVSASAEADEAMSFDSRGVSSEAFGEARKVQILRSDWNELQTLVRDCRMCHISRTRLNPVFGDGVEKRRLVLVGEAPGGEEDRQGKAFVGPSGKLLNHILEACGLDRQKDLAVYNTLKCRPPLNATPEASETLACRPFLEQQIRLSDPDVIVAMGKPAASWFFNNVRALNPYRGRVHEIDVAGRTRKIIVTFHPSYLLRSPYEKRKAWLDWCLVLDTLQG